MTEQKKTLTYFWLGVCILLTVNLFIFTYRLISVPIALQVQYIPDDAYYYLLLAKNFVIFKFWTFDSGVSVTSGFHPLLAYLLAGLFSLFQPDLDSFVDDAVVLNAIISATAVVLLMWWGLREKRIYFLIFLALIISSRNFIINAGTIIEWSLVVLFSSLYAILFHYNYTNTKTLAIIFFSLIGFLGSLARVDFGLLPAAIFIAAFLYYLKLPVGNKKLLYVPTIGLLGAVIGVLVVLTHNYFFTGDFLQSSARIKNYWIQILGRNYFGSLFLIKNVIGIAGLFVVMGILLVVIFKRRKIDVIQSVKFNYNEKILLSASGIAIIGYLLFYSYSGSIQPWYTANFMVPVLAIFFVTSKYLTKMINGRISLWLQAIVLATIIFNIWRLYPVNSFHAPWPHQKVMLLAGKYLHQNELDARVGAWNAGIVGYYQGGSVINLDGLVNNEVYPFVTNNTLPVYLSNRQIDYIIDFENMLTVEEYRLRGGYDAPEFLCQLQRVKVFDNRQISWRHMTLYYIDRGKSASDCETIEPFLSENP